MHLNLTGIAFLLVISTAQLDLSDQSRILGSKCNWTCDNYLHEYLCIPVRTPIVDNCQKLINLGEPCCIAIRSNNKALCINKSSNHVQVANCLHPLDNETKAKEGHCHQSMYRPVGIEGSDCESLSGKILDTVQVLTEFQCLDLCMRNWRCVAFNILKSEEKSRPCQLLESYCLSSEAECKKDYIGKKLDREAFYKAYLSPGCTVREVT